MTVSADRVGKSAITFTTNFYLRTLALTLVSPEAGEKFRRYEPAT